MGDGGFITQITDLKFGSFVAVSDSTMRCKVIHKAPLDSKCANSSNPIAGQGECQFKSEVEPTSWKTPIFDDSSWSNAIEYSAAQVRPKDGYDRIKRDSNATLIWKKLMPCFVGNREITKIQCKSSRMHPHFKHFKNVETDKDSDYLLVALNGLS